jgi:hypothetical protein
MKTKHIKELIEEVEKLRLEISKKGDYPTEIYVLIQDVYSELLDFVNERIKQKKEKFWSLFFWVTMALMTIFQYYCTYLRYR